jgi:DNA modification methylase
MPRSHRPGADYPLYTLLDGAVEAKGAPKMNKLLYGDNLFIMSQRLKKDSVDLIYLDPPFKSDQTYNLIYSQATGRPIPEQAQAFGDTWELNTEREQLAQHMPEIAREEDVDVPYFADFWRLWLSALRDTQPHLLAYLTYMVQRLLHMRAILKPTGSIYLHCDPTASHYIKVMMDAIFGHSNFRSEIIWKRTSAHSSAKRFGPIHDVLLYYTKTDKFTWNPQHTPHDPEYVKAFYRHSDAQGAFRLSDLTADGTRDGASGLPWRGIDPTRIGRHWAAPRAAMKIISAEKWAAMTTQEKLDALDAAGRIHWPKKEGGTPAYKRYLHEMPGVPIQDVWTDIPPVASQATERLGYPTQKPVPLLERIIRCSTNPGDVVFDPFCGCGTTVYAAHQTGRRWIGCDIAILAVRIVEKQLYERYGLKRDEHYEEEGIPNSVASATALFEEDPFQFENWAVEYVEGFPTKKTGDRGIDGRIWFETSEHGFDVMVLSVKGGKVQPTDVRDLIGVLTNEPDAKLAGLITLHEPSKAMRAAAAQAGVWEYRGIKYPRCQILTVREMIEDKRTFSTPTKIGLKTSTSQGSLPLV